MTETGKRIIELAGRTNNNALVQDQHDDRRQQLEFARLLSEKREVKDDNSKTI